MCIVYMIISHQMYVHSFPHKSKVILADKQVSAGVKVPCTKALTAWVVKQINGVTALPIVLIILLKCIVHTPQSIGS